MKKKYIILIGIFFILVGILLSIYAGYDDSPGGVLMGVSIMLISSITIYLKLKNKIKEMKKEELQNIIEESVFIKMKDVPEHMVGIDLTWLDKEIGKIKNRLFTAFSSLANNGGGA